MHKDLQCPFETFLTL